MSLVREFRFWKAKAQKNHPRVDARGLVGREGGLADCLSCCKGFEEGGDVEEVPLSIVVEVGDGVEVAKGFEERGDIEEIQNSIIVQINHTVFIRCINEQSFSAAKSTIRGRRNDNPEETPELVVLEYAAGATTNNEQIALFIECDV